MNKIKLFDNFIQIVNYYLKNKNLFVSNKTIELECEYGTIEFYNLNNSNNSNKIIVHSIFVKEQYRKKGLCGEFIKCIIDNLNTNDIFIIQSVLSKILYEYLKKFEYNGFIFVAKKEGFVCQKK